MAVTCGRTDGQSDLNLLCHIPIFFIFFLYLSSFNHLILPISLFFSPFLQFLSHLFLRFLFPLFRTFFFNLFQVIIILFLYSLLFSTSILSLITFCYVCISLVRFSVHYSSVFFVSFILLFHSTSLLLLCITAHQRVESGRVAYVEKKNIIS
jgi:hypothetical protein